MTTKVFAKPTDTGVEFLSTTFDATDDGQVRPGFEDDSKYTQAGWLPVVRVDRPAIDPGYMSVFDGWVITSEAVTESWRVVQRPQPYPSWTWEEGQGWLPPTPMPETEGEWSWDEDSLSWIDLTPAE